MKEVDSLRKRPENSIQQLHVGQKHKIDACFHAFLCLVQMNYIIVKIVCRQNYYFCYVDYRLIHRNYFHECTTLASRAR